MSTEETEVVELSDCCRAEVVLAVRYRSTSDSPAERDYLCRSCGSWCETISLVRSVWDGTLTDPETGESGLEQTPVHDEV
jgi:hypothetical protein